jgi:hypothetical protein
MIEIDKLLDTQRAWQAISTNDDTAIRKMAFESLVKCADAIAVLGENLRKIGYVWAVTEQIPPNVIEKNILNIEKTIGLPIPQILAMFGKRLAVFHSLISINTSMSISGKSKRLLHQSISVTGCMWTLVMMHGHLLFVMISKKIVLQKNRMAFF